jgi:hypothetical protein
MNTMKTGETLFHYDSRTSIIGRNESQDDTDPNGHFRYLS